MFYLYLLITIENQLLGFMENNELHAISPIDGRYMDKTVELRKYFSEYALMKYRVRVEVLYLLALNKAGLPEMGKLTESDRKTLSYIASTFNEQAGLKVKEIEKITNHDVKAIEYYVKEKVVNIGLSYISEFVHFGLTSQDINNTAFPLMLKEAQEKEMIPGVESIISKLRLLASRWSSIPMLARTHGQPASPTSLGKEIFVYVERLEIQLKQLKNIEIKAKFGGASGNFNAHKLCYPEINWPNFADRFVKVDLGLSRSRYTTQIEHYDNLAAGFDAWTRISNILIDFCRDVWMYISMDYFKQRVNPNEVGSSAMPHKVNPIDFENAEGNLGMAMAILHHLSVKLPVSRLQRDLTDSTALRNIGVPFGHILIAFKSIHKGLEKLVLNEQKLKEDLENNWAVVAEGIQSVLRKIGYPQPYEALKSLTRGQTGIGQAEIQAFIESLEVDDVTKKLLLSITPQNYVGYLVEE
jgi:adenylosuccinate lyase